MRHSEPGNVGQTIHVLERNHPTGVLGRQGADFIQLLDLLWGEFNIDGRQILIQLLDALSTDNDRGDERLRQYPAQRNRGHTCIVRLGSVSILARFFASEIPSAFISCQAYQLEQPM